MLASAQIALAAVLLVGAGLLIRTLSELGRTRLGFDPEHVLTLRISAGWSEKADMKRVERRMARTLEALAAIPGVEAAALTINPPGGGEDYPQQFRVVGRDSDSAGQQMFADLQGVSPDYFRVLNIPVLAGGTCRLTAETAPPLPTLVNRSLADRYLSGVNPIQQQLEVGSKPLRIVGVVADVREHGYAEDPRPSIYYCELPGFFPDPT
jgi:putative ABC transport system permease protein